MHGKKATSIFLDAQTHGQEGFYLRWTHACLSWTELGTAQPQLVLLFLSLLFKFYDYKSNTFKKKHLKGVVEGAFMPKGYSKKKNSIFKDIVQIGGREVNPITKN